VRYELKIGSVEVVVVKIVYKSNDFFGGVYDGEKF